MLTLDQIKNATFERAGLKGYKADSVDDFIDNVIETVEKLQSEKEDAEAKLEILAEKLEDYRKDEDSLRAALLGAQKLGNSVVSEARQKAEIILRDATIKSDSMLAKAEDKIGFYKEELVRMKAEVSAFKNAMLSLYRDHIELISQIPAEEPAESEEPAPQPEAAEAEAPAAESEEHAVDNKIDPGLFESNFDFGTHTEEGAQA